MRSATICLLLLGLARSASLAQDTAAYAPASAALRHSTTSEMRQFVERYALDHSLAERRFDIPDAPMRRAALAHLDSLWSVQLEAMPFDSFSEEGRIDWILMKGELDHEQAVLGREARQFSDVLPLISFASTVFGLEETRRSMATIQPAQVARALADLADTVTATQRRFDALMRDSSAGSASRRPTKIAAYRAAEVLGRMRQTLAGWFRYYDGYDPMFTWWAHAPYTRADTAMGTYIQFLRTRIVGWRPGEDEPIVGLPIGRAALMDDLRYEMIPYTPEELITIAQREFAWCESEMRRASRDMGLGDDWHAALERVKNDYVEPGKQTDLVRDLAREAVAFVQSHDLVSVPPLARDGWRMEMMTPERQKVNPFFTGGEVMSVSYPTESMSEDDKLMSMRGNNIHFARATVFHELIPGHELQGFMSARYNPQRRLFATPFWSEGNAFYWETIFWDLDFPRSPEDRIGMLFWRMHRAARIIFSLSFHLGTMTPQQAIDFLVTRVGHERANAEGEVRRSFNGNYSPLYQVAYMIGGLQFRSLHHELVDSGRMTNRAFHDAILEGGDMPVEMVRARLTNQGLIRDYRAGWKFDQP